MSETIPRYGPSRLAKLRRYRQAQVSEEFGQLLVEALSRPRDVVVAEAREPGAGLIDGEVNLAVEVLVDEGPQWGVQHHAGVLPVHRLRHDVVSHQVADGPLGMPVEFHD